MTEKHLPLLLLLFLLACSGEPKTLEVKHIRYLGDYNRDFNDLNEKHLTAATSIGMPPVENREAAEKVKKGLKRIDTNDHYEVEELTHSIPYLVSPAADLLNQIGKNFKDSLVSLNAPHYKLIVTSVTRTQDDIQRLGTKNINASMNSAHCYGTTFDISWKRFSKNDKRMPDLTEDQLKKVLAGVLRDLQKQDRCYIKHERKQACFHITTR